ncbi:putative cyclin-like F-box [Rosellinia necatrix]|uniref:Putative cyclin-like F-box n=1 Tax=Rosellinia necatrix TaxID=77044 RepID=A0A1W2TC99_ROSNE|nr:putative cyclin-like F-box [Rosellinia necatrix]
MSDNARLAELRRFIFIESGRTLEEFRYVKVLLSNIHTDLIGDLPLELVVSIAVELEPEEFASCLYVSKAWRRRFLSDPVITAYARDFWPAIIDGPVDRATFLTILAKDVWAFYTHPPMMLPRPDQVTWDNTAGYRFDPAFHNPTDEIIQIYNEFSGPLIVNGASSPLYSSGKVAWRPLSWIVAVDDLREQTRKLFTPPSGLTHGNELVLRALGSKLVVGTINRLLIAWDHTDNRASEKLLLCPSVECTTDDDRVAVILQSGDVVIWTPGYAALQLDLNALPVTPKEFIGTDRAAAWKPRQRVFLGPRDRNTLFLASSHPFCTGSIYRILLAVHEFSGRNYVTSSYLTTHAHHVFFEDRRDRRDEDNPVILATSYESDHSCIFFGHPHDEDVGTATPFGVFDKIKGKFITPDKRKWRYWDKQTRLKYICKSTKWGGADLDFEVSFRSNGYEVVRSGLPKQEPLGCVGIHRSYCEPMYTIHDVRRPTLW